MQKVAKELGFSLSTLVNAYLKQLIETKNVNFTVKDEVPSKYFIDSMKQADADIKAGRVSPSFDNAKDANSWLDDPKKKFKNEHEV